MNKRIYAPIKYVIVSLLFIVLGISGAYIAVFLPNAIDEYLPSSEDVAFERQLFKYFAGNPEFVPVAEIFPDEWDEVCYASPYEKISRAIPYKNKDYDLLRSDQTLSEGAWALIFIKDQAITYRKIRVSLLWYGNGDVKECVPRKQAALKITSDIHKSNIHPTIALFSKSDIGE